MKRIMILVCLAALVVPFVFSQSTLTGWSDWQTIDQFLSHRVRCARLNTANNLYEWEVEVKNSSDHKVHVLIALTDVGQQPSDRSYGGNYIDAGDSYVFPINWAKAGPGGSVNVWWKNIQYSQ